MMTPIVVTAIAAVIAAASIVVVSGPTVIALGPALVIVVPAAAEPEVQLEAVAAIVIAPLARIRGRRLGPIRRLVRLLVHRLRLIARLHAVPTTRPIAPAARTTLLP